MTDDSQRCLETISQALYDKKGQNIIAIDIRGVTVLSDFIIVADGTVDRHVRALGSEVMEQMKEQGFQPLHFEGDQVGDWMVIDYGWIIVHIFTPELREKYRIENLWNEGELVDLSIHASERGQG